MQQVIQIIFLLVAPYLILRLTKISKKTSLLSPILLCYLAGIIIGNLSFIPVDKDLAMTLCELAVPLAIPLILFSTDLKKWLHLAKKTSISFLLVIISVIASSFLGAAIFSPYTEEFWQLSGMLVGVYTGGTPNLMAIGMGLNVAEETLVLINTADVITGGLYFLFLISGAKWLWGKFLPPFQKEEEAVQAEAQAAAAGEKPAPARFFALASLFLLSVVIVGISAGISFLVTRKLETSIVMLIITTLGIAASFNRKIRNTQGTYEAGQYLILVFSLAIGVNVDIAKLFSSSSIVFLYTVFVLTMAILLHLLLAMVFRIDTDTTIITSTAGIYGPAFIIPVAEGIKNREVVVSGLTCGLAGYAIGNYLGFAVAWLLRALF
ncbi:MAG: DUF819 family protein [Clostridia bacterium]|nr:DUF819 family protein [Clostridia bacterium]